MEKKTLNNLDSIIEVNDSDEMLIVDILGKPYKVTVSQLKEALVKGEDIKFNGDDSNVYKLVVKNGKLEAVPEIVFTKADAREGENLTLYDGLVINQIYGGGNSVNTTPISHSFIELYNYRTEDLNLKGLYLWYRAKSGTWQSLPLQGIVPSRHSFLIRCGKLMEFYAPGVRCNITDYDMSWDIPLSDKGFSVYLCIGSDIPEENPIRQTTDPSGNVNWTNQRYIDLLGGGGVGETDTIWAYETRYLKGMSKDVALHRVDYANAGGKNIGSNLLVKGNNESDCELLDYKQCNVEIYRPRCTKDGRWTEFYDKPKQSPLVPSMINIAFGEDDTTRTFTFQTPLTDIEGFVRLKGEGEEKYTEYPTEISLASHIDGDTTVHRCIVHNLTPGMYEYQVGIEGCVSDPYNFEVKSYDNNSVIRMLWTTDQQSWTKREYDVWRICGRYLSEVIAQNTDFDFHLNTGDISQNADRTFEWKYYYDYAKKITKEMPHMISCGNNDLIDKNFSDAFNYYITNENKFANSVYAFDLGFVHFVCLNSNTDKTYVDGTGTEGGYVSTDAFLQAQADWLDTHLTQVKARATKPRWIIVYSHLSPFTVGRTRRLQRWVKVIEKHKVNMFLCGHNHAYSRSKALYTGYDFNSSSKYNDYVTTTSATSSELKIVNEYKADGSTEINRTEDTANGTVYVLNQACGFKLSGKEKPLNLAPKGIDQKHYNADGSPWWIANQGLPSKPCYATLDIGYNSITFKEYTMDGIISYDVYKNATVNISDINAISVSEYDSLTLNYNQRW